MLMYMCIKITPSVCGSEEEVMFHQAFHPDCLSLQFMGPQIAEQNLFLFFLPMLTAHFIKVINFPFLICLIDVHRASPTAVILLHKQFDEHK